GAGGASRSGEHRGTMERAALRDFAAPRCGFGKRQRRFAAVDAEHRRTARARRRYREPAAVAIKVEHACTVSQSGDKAAVVALIEEPAGLLAGQDIGLVMRAILLEHDRPIDMAGADPGLGGEAFERAR